MNLIEIQTKKLEEFLLARGWHDKETVNIWEQGETIVFNKERNGVRLVFSFFFESQGLEWYWRGDMSAYFNLYPSEPYMHPGVHLEVNNIIQEYLNDFDTFENILVTGVKLQPIRA